MENGPSGSPLKSQSDGHKFYLFPSPGRVCELRFSSKWYHTVWAVRVLARESAVNFPANFETVGLVITWGAGSFLKKLILFTYSWFIYIYIYICCTVAKSCLTLCDPMDCSIPGFPFLHFLPGFAQTHVHWVSDAIQPSHSLSPSSPAFNLPQDQGLFQWVSSLHQVAKVLEL